MDRIDDICKEYNIKNYTINKDGSIDVFGPVNLRNKNLSKLPLKFGKVSGPFACDGNKLTSLEGSPKEVGSIFYCYNNYLTSLKGGPISVGEDYYCNNNKLIDIEGFPKHFKADRDQGYGADFTDNPIFEIIKITKNKNNYLSLSKIINGLKNQIGKDKTFKSRKELVNYLGPSHTLPKLSISTQATFVKYLNEYDVIRDGNKIVEMRLEEAYYMTMKEELPRNKRKFKNYQLI